MPERVHACEHGARLRLESRHRGLDLKDSVQRTRALLAAQRGGIKTVLIPEENTKDLTEIPDNIKNKLEILPVRWIDRVLEVALERQPEPLPEIVEPVQPASLAPEIPGESTTLVKH